MVERKNFNKYKIQEYTRLNYDILDGMVDWVRVIDTNNTVIYANKPMIEVFGESIIGKTCYNSLGRNCPCERCISNITIATGTISEKEEVVGSRIFSVKSSPVRDEEGNIYAAVEVLRDVTKEKKLEKEIKEKNRKMTEDLEFAKALQNKILPQKGEFHNVSVDFMYKPSEMLSGDIFDVFSIDENHIGVYISDVVGHGVKASMMTMFIRQTMRAIKDDILNPGQALLELHKRFLDLGLDYDKYFTIFYGVLDKRNRLLKYVNGGHNSIPILLNRDKFELLNSKGYPISYLFESVEYEEYTTLLNKSDKLIFYTDGIIEAKNSNGEAFGLDRFLEIVKKSENNIMKDLENSIDYFYDGEQVDDFAVLTVEIS